MNIFNLFKKQKSEKPRKSDFLIIFSFITGVPCQMMSGGSLTGAGSQDINYCQTILAQMGKKKQIKIDTYGGIRTITRDAVVVYLKQYPFSVYRHLLSKT